MLSIQHVMSAMISSHGDRKWMDEHMAALVFPDAVRAYSGPRPYTHFERSSDGQDVSWWRMPVDMKSVNMESVAESLTNSHLATYRPCVIGEQTDIEAFREHNGHLPEAMHEGIETHLRQDVAFDDLVRNVIDCSGKYEGKFSFDGQEYTGESVRRLIGRMEQEGIYAAAHRLYTEYGMTCDSAWIEREVRPVLERDYPKELADKTLSFMRIDPDVDKWIREHDWSHLHEGILPVEVYDDLYDGVEIRVDSVSRARSVERLMPDVLPQDDKGFSFE